MVLAALVCKSKLNSNAACVHLCHNAWKDKPMKTNKKQHDTNMKQTCNVMKINNTEVCSLLRIDRPPQNITTISRSNAACNSGLFTENISKGTLDECKKQTSRMSSYLYEQGTIKSDVYTRLQWLCYNKSNLLARSFFSLSFLVSSDFALVTSTELKHL